MSITTAPTDEKLITGEELYAIPDLGPCELIDGRIVPMSPAGGEHGRLEFELGRLLANFVAEHGLGYVVGGETGIYTRRHPDRVRGVDVAFFSRERLPDGPPDAYIQVAPELAVEIMSPGDSWQEVRQKVAEYFAIGTDRVWIVEPENRAIVVFHSPTEMTTFGEGDTVLGEGLLTGFTVPVAALFKK